MRTNIVLDDHLVQRAQALTGIRTKREVVHEALRLLICADPHPGRVQRACACAIGCVPQVDFCPPNCLSRPV